MEKNGKIKIHRAVIIVLLAAHLLLIFGFSHQKAQQSDGTSSSVVVMLVRLLHSDFDSWSEQEQKQTVEALQHIVRKAAHLTEYAVLGVLICALCLTYRKRMLLLPGFAFGALYAVSDEVHQLFIEGRSGQLSDVLIDSSGVFLGMAAFLLLVRLLTYIMSRRRKKTV